MSLGRWVSEEDVTISKQAFMFVLDHGFRIQKKIQEPGGWGGGGWVGQKRFYNPLWIFRAQLGFRVQVRAKCGNKTQH